MTRRLLAAAYPNDAPPLYAWLAQQPRGVVAEMPMTPGGVPGSDPAYSYLSTFHWQPIVNGYSGFYPASYLSRLTDTAEFPDERALRRLQRDGVRYLVVHLGGFPRQRRDEVLRVLREDYGLAELSRQSDGTGEAVVFSMRYRTNRYRAGIQVAIRARRSV